MTKFIPYAEDPFKQPPLYRVVPLAKTDKAYYALFIKNLIAALYYQDFKIKTFPYHRETKKDQVYLFKLYMNGELRIGDKYLGILSPVIQFYEMELKTLQWAGTPEVVAYIDFLDRHKKVFKSIDRAVEYDFDADSLDYETCIYDKMGTVKYFEEFEVSNVYESIKLKLVEQLKKQLIANLNIQGLDSEEIREDLDALNYHFNNELIDGNVMAQIKVHSVTWFGQMLRSIGFDIGWNDYKDFFDQMKSLFCEAIDYQPPAPKITDIPYANHIFSNPKAYLLFHELASKTDKKVIISYLFRRMGEKENFIKVRDTEFRDWFNTADYPRELDSSTHTYERAYTEERELFVNLLYEKYGLIEN